VIVPRVEGSEPDASTFAAVPHFVVTLLSVVLDEVMPGITMIFTVGVVLVAAQAK